MIASNGQQLGQQLGMSRRERGKDHDRLQGTAGRCAAKLGRNTMNAFIIKAERGETGGKKEACWHTSTTLQQLRRMGSLACIWQSLQILKVLQSSQSSDGNHQQWQGSHKSSSMLPFS